MPSPWAAAEPVRASHDTFRSCEIDSTVTAARAAAHAGDSDRALALYDEALALLDGAELTPLLAEVLRGKGAVLRDRGYTAASEALVLRGLAVAETCGDDVGRAQALNALAALLQRRGRLGAAERYYHDAAAIAVRCGETRLLGSIEQNLGVLASTRADHDGALVRFRMSLTAFTRAGDEEGTTCVLTNLGMLYMQYGRYDQARDMFERALGIARRTGNARHQLTLELNLAALALALDDLHDASLLIARALAAASACRDRVRLAEGWKLRATVERRRGRLDEAAASLQRAGYYARESEEVLLQLDVLRELGAVHHDRGEPDDSRRLWTEAAAGFAGLGARREAEALRRELATLQ